MGKCDKDIESLPWYEQPPRILFGPAGKVYFLSDGEYRSATSESGTLNGPWTIDPIPSEPKPSYDGS